MRGKARRESVVVELGGDKRFAASVHTWFVFVSALGAECLVRGLVGRFWDLPLGFLRSDVAVFRA